MSFESFTAVLNATDFPFVSDFFQRAIIVPGIDQPPRVPRPLLGDVSNINAELGQHFYAQNLMPTAEGLMSVGYSQLVPGIPGNTDFDQVITLRDANENNFLFVPASGKNYIFTANSGAWNATSSFVPVAGSSLVTRAYVNGRTFICYQRDSIREFNVGTGLFNPVAFTFPPGLGIGNIDVIGASNNYLLWASNITVGWSSLIDPTDLNPSILTGAGLAIPQDVKGPVRAIVATAGGFILYTTKNAVAALFTNNARAPFVFREVSGAGGLQTSEQVSLEASLKEQYAWTTAGLQKISINTTEVMSAAATDFIAGRILETFDLSTLFLTVERLTADMKVKIAFVAGRYLVISYGKSISPQLYTHALVFDTALKRWGKLRVDHVDAFEYPYPNLIGFVTTTPPKQSLAFLQNDGTVQLLLMDYRTRQDQGVLLLGRYQLVRQKYATFQTVELESVQQTYPPNAYLLVSPDGKNNNAPAPLTLLSDGGTIKRYGAPSNGAARTGKNLSLLLTGRMELTTALFTLTRHGNR